jgi:uncharacterized protein (DUF1800 family)
MLPGQPSFTQIALNRVTFGATASDVANATQIGWEGWVSAQLSAPPGDDSTIAAFLAGQTMPIQYAAATSGQGTWTAVDEVRPLNYLSASIPTLWNVAINAGSSISPAERERVLQEVLSATWIRNVGAEWQLREFMTDFWHNHFNIGKVPTPEADSLLASYDRDTIRPNVFGNFRSFLQAVATSPAMGLYLDNAQSTATTPNENYGRELLELHTLGARAYLGVTPPPDYTPADGYSDQDVTEDSRGLSGWTLNMGQRGPTSGVKLPSNGEFVYNPLQHNTLAGVFLGVDLSQVSGAMAQGSKVLDLAAYHPSTAIFVCTKLCTRIFGDSPPQSVIDRAISAWNATQTAPDQIAQVLQSILLGGAEIGTGPQVKIRRPYERVMAMLRTTASVVNASQQADTVFSPVNDALFAWATPDGRPDVNSYWLSTGATLTAWNLVQQIPNWSTITTNLIDQTPMSALASPTALVEYWVGQMIGFEPSSATMNGLITDQSESQGVPAAGSNPTNAEKAARRLIALIAMTDEFSHR